MSAAQLRYITIDFLRDGERHAAWLAPPGAVLLLAGAASLTGYGAIAAVLGAILLLLACTSQRDGLLILGPLARAELARRARLHAPRTWLIRSLCALGAGAIIIGNFAEYASLDAASISRYRLNYINGQIANWFIASFFIAVVFLSLQLFPTAIVEERIAKRWDILRTTDLRPREILLGKLFGRLPAVLEPLLAAAPVVAILPFYGAVSPLMALSLLIACIGLAFGIGSMGLYCSLFEKKPGAAIGGTLLFYVLYMALSGLLLLLNSFGVISFNDFVYAFGSGNPGVQIEYFHRTSGNYEIELLIGAWHFGLFHFGLGLAFLMAAARRMRLAKSGDAATMPISSVKSRSQSSRKAAVIRPPVTDMPITWWERYGCLNPAQAYVVRALSPKVLVIIAAITFIVSLFAVLFEIGDYPKGDLEISFVLQSIAGILVAYGSLYVAVAALFRAARCMARERQADTLEPLLLTPLTGRELLFQKWLGVMLCDWPLVGLMAAVAIPVALTGIFHPIGLLLFMLAAAATVGLLAALGLAVGVNARSPFRASLGAFFAVYLLANLLGGIGTAISQPMPLKNIQGLIPVFFPSFVAAPFIDRETSSLTALIKSSIACLMGSAAYAWLAYAFFSIAVARFGTGRK